MHWKRIILIQKLAKIQIEVQFLFVYLQSVFG